MVVKREDFDIMEVLERVLAKINKEFFEDEELRCDFDCSQCNPEDDE